MSVKAKTQIRGGKRQSVTKLHQKIINELDTFSIDHCRATINRLTHLKKDLLTLDEFISQTNIESDAWTEDIYLADCEVCEEYIVEVESDLVALQSRIDSLTISASSPPGVPPSGVPPPGFPPGTGHQPPARVTLPHIELPTFDGKPESYNKFITSLEALLSEYGLTSAQKFSLLQKQLSGHPKKLIECLSLNELNFEAAKKLLDEAFSDRLTQQFSVISALCNLKLPEYANDAFSWCGDARVLAEQVTALDVTDSVFTQYFLLKGLNSDFKKHLTNVTQKSRPSLDEIKAAMFEANSRYMEERAREGQHAGSPTLSAAIAVKPSDKGKCPLCSLKGGRDASHKLNECKAFPDADSKLKRLHSCDGCMKCGLTNHTAKKCNFKFKGPCFKCKGQHMSFLCPKAVKAEQGSAVEKRSTKNQAKTWSTSVSTAAVSTKIYNDVILPTCTVYSNIRGVETPLRLFKDLGSQTTFYLGSLDEIPNHEVLEHTDIAIHGANSVSEVKLPVIRFPVNVPGQGQQTITAVHRRDMKIEFSAPGLCTIVDDLKRKGAVIADKFISSDKISEISILLGSDHSHIVPLSQLNFSVDDLQISAVFDSPAGVLLSGSAGSYSKNIESFPPALCPRAC